jgi:beta-N-acetylhexosaminidase
VAGNDLLLTTAPVEWEKGIDPRAVVVELVRGDPRLVARLDESVLRILKAKVRHGLLREGVAAR